MSPDPFAPIDLFSFPLFASMVGGHEDHVAGLLDLILEMRETDEGLERSNRNDAWHSGPAFTKSRDPHIGWLLAHVTSFAERALGPMYGSFEHQQLRLGSYWANVLGPGGWNEPHHHHPQHWSGVFYVSTPDVGTPEDPRGFIEFLNPSPVQSQWGQGSFAFGPRPGLTMLFPSSLVHLVHPHRGDGHRVSIAYNFTVTPRPGRGP